MSSSSSITQCSASGLGVLIVSQYNLPIIKKNMNAYQRIYYGGRRAQVHLLVRKRAEVSDELRSRAKVYHAPMHNRWMFLLYAILFSGYLRVRGCRAIMTEPSGFAVVGLFAKILFGYRWVLDVWDRPRWRTGEHEKGQRVPLSDRLVFWVMAHASLYILSVLPRAAKDIQMPEARCVQVKNAIDLSVVAETPPHRSENDDGTLHLAFGRSKFWGTQGLDILLKVAAQLQSEGCPVHFHLVGELPNEERGQIEDSEAGKLFTMHGFLDEGCIPLYRTIHVGLVPYPAFEDLSYIFPIKVLEHLSQGNPLIVTRLPGLCGMVRHEYNGLVVTPGDPVELVNAIRRMQNDRPLFNRLARNALDSIQEFDVEKKHDQIFAAIHDCCGVPTNK